MAVDAEHVEASCNNGVLTLRLPKAETARPRRINIGRGSGRTIEDVIEPYLIQQGYVQRTPRGRMATAAAYRHLGVEPPPMAVP